MNLGDLELAQAAIQLAAVAQRRSLEEHRGAVQAALALVATGNPPAASDNKAAVAAVGAAVALAGPAGLALAGVRAVNRGRGRKRVAELQRLSPWLDEVSHLLQALADELGGTTRSAVAAALAGAAGKAG